MGLHKTTSIFIEELIGKWGNIYDTSECEYKGSSFPVILTCKVHNERFSFPAAQLVMNNGKHRTGCKECQKLKNIKDSIPESDIQMAFISYVRTQYPHLMLTCNGLFNNRGLVEMSQKMGYCVGIPDIFILNHLLFIELKSKNGKLSQAQIDCHNKIKEMGIFTVKTIYSLDDAKRLIDEYECTDKMKDLKV